MDSSGLDHVVLSSKLCKELYKSGVVNLEPPAIEENKTVPFEGANRRHVLIVYDARLKREDEELLQNLMKACGLNMDDVALVNFREQEISIADILNELETEKALFFGIPSLSINLPLDDVEEKVLELEDRLFLKTAPLGALHKNVEKKKALWLALRKMFDL